MGRTGPAGHSSAGWPLCPPRAQPLSLKAAFPERFSPPMESLQEPLGVFFPFSLVPATWFVAAKCTLSSKWCKSPSLRSDAESRLER